MGAAIQLYAGFALLVMAIIAIIAIAAIVSNLMAAVRRRFGGTRGLARTRAHDDFSAPARSSHSGASRSDTPASPSDNPPASR